jgi:hypothetical protein
MITELDKAQHRSLDVPDAAPFIPSKRTHTGARGRPKIEVDPGLLRTALRLRSLTQLGQTFKCSPRTLRRRAMEHGLVDPAPPVHVEATRTADSPIAREYASSSPAVSDITNEQLDQLVASILQSFPDFGRRMIKGSLTANGYRVPEDRITASYNRVHGAPGIFGGRRIHRKRYKVPGANSLWHHDGQHGKC